MAGKAKKPRSAAQIAAQEKMLAARKLQLATKKSLEGTGVQTAPAFSEATPLVIPDPEGEALEHEILEQVQHDAEVTTTLPAPVSAFDSLSESEKDRKIIELQQQVIEMLQANQGAKVEPAAAIEAYQKMGLGNGVSVTAQGGVQGQIFKYPVDPGHYADPTDRLYDDPRLSRFAMRENYIFRWDVEGETYEKHGITYTEPRFIVELYKFTFDEETGAKTNLIQLINRNLLHEDEFVTTVMANKLGLTEMFPDKAALMDEVRYYRIRDWLLPLFTPVKTTSFKNKLRSMVINGKAVEVRDSEVLLDDDSANSKAGSLGGVQ